MKKLVSIIMPAYNAAQFLPHTLDSVLQQTWPDWELLLVDDGSTDNTKEIVQEYISRDARIKYLHQPNGRQGKARNYGLRASIGQYIAFLDADDIWLPNMLTLQVASLEEYQADLVCCNSYVFREDSQLDYRGFSKLSTLDDSKGKHTYQGTEGVNLFLLHNRIPILTVVAKREAVMKVGGFGEELPFQNAEDYHLWLKMLFEGCLFVKLDYILTAYRKHANSVSDSDGGNYRQVVEAKVDLSEQYHAYRSLIRASIPQSIVNSLSELSKSEDNRFYPAIDRYLEMTGKDVWKLFFKSCQLAKARKLALRSSYYIFNRTEMS